VIFCCPNHPGALGVLNFELEKWARVACSKAIRERDSIIESDEENHPPNRPKPVVTQGDAKLHLKINLCHMKRLSELMNENLSTLNDTFSDSSLSDATKIRKARSTVNLLYPQVRLLVLSSSSFLKKWHLPYTVEFVRQKSGTNIMFQWQILTCVASSECCTWLECTYVLVLVKVSRLAQRKPSQRRTTTIILLY
jgi:hypothetical protein